MRRGKEYAGIDWFRLPAALMVIAIHTAPFSKISESLDFLLTYCLGRVAVPFFLMTTGYFVLAPACSGGLRRFLKKNVLLYLAVTLLYLPLTVYAGNLPESLAGAVRDLMLDGTFYHLWYFPAAILGSVIVSVLLRVCSFRAAGVFAVCAYLVGLLGDSLYGAAQAVPVLRAFYGGIFSICSYTRNGIFYAPVFLMMGVMLRRSEKMRGPEKMADRRGEQRRNTVLLMISSVLMMTEGYLSFHFGLQRHNSMYLFLLPVMYFLYRLLLSMKGNAPVWTRSCSMLVYVIHPAVIVALRGAAGAAGLETVLVENPLVLFLCVSVISFAAAMAAGWVYRKKVTDNESERTRMDRT
ncbi:MAG TPA: hypothetical protein H9955_02275 [Candidatus Mediterraneibacter cottocaccae]|nr:hypothetical protein [Candidatus Mediterraneibacter cottocaccae]